MIPRSLAIVLAVLDFAALLLLRHVRHERLAREQEGAAS